MHVKVYLDDDDKPDGAFWAGSAAHIAHDLSRTRNVRSVIVMHQDNAHTVSYWKAAPDCANSDHD